jgi:hypothetical protein
MFVWRAGGPSPAAQRRFNTHGIFHSPLFLHALRASYRSRSAKTKPAHPFNRCAGLNRVSYLLAPL